MRTKLLLVLLLLAACGGPATPSSTPTMAPARRAGRITFAGSTTVQPLAQKLAEAFRAREPNVECEIAAGGSLVGINAVHEGAADIGMASRELTPEEVRNIQRYQIASDVLALIVHPANPVANLTRQQLRAIYQGDVTRWSEVGGADAPITVLVRETSSGTRGAFDELVLDKGAPSAPVLEALITAGEIQARVAADPNAIGYVGFGNLDQSVKLLAIDGVAPSPAAARDGSYPLVRPLLLLVGPLSSPLAEAFIAFTLSPEGQQIVGADGWVSTSPVP
jgi:phosphate transport system substrate-binding protein